MQWVTSVSHAQIVENQNIATATLLRWNKFARLGFLITFFVEFELLFEKKKLNRTTSIISKIQLGYLDE